MVVSGSTGQKFRPQPNSFLSLAEKGSKVGKETKVRDSQQKSVGCDSRERGEISIRPEVNPCLNGRLPKGRRLLLHICCGNCACFAKKFLEEKKFAITGFWYNPNIHPYSEYQKRLMTVGYFACRTNLSMIWNVNYNPEEFFNSLCGNFSSEQRCSYCYILRLSRTAEIAKEKGFKLFSTTLLYSIYQKHDLIRDIGKKIAKQYGIEFYYADYRVGWQDGIEISKKLNLYRQNYCGCVFSEKERHFKDKNQ